MKVIIALWNLDNSSQTIESLREYLRNGGVAPWESIKGLRLKLWISDANNNVWGAVLLWESAEYMTQKLPPHRAMDLIGYPPNIRFVFDVEATIEGDFSLQFLKNLGLSFEE